MPVRYGRLRGTRRTKSLRLPSLVDVDDFWQFIERSASETAGPDDRAAWLEQRLSRVAPAHVVDFEIHLGAARRPIDTYAMWGAAAQIMGGWCSDDGFWYFQPWLIGQGQRWWRHAADDVDNLADLPAVRQLAARPRNEWDDTWWPGWESLNYVALAAYERITGEAEGLDDALAARGHLRRHDPMPPDDPWSLKNPAEIERWLPRLADLFPLHRNGATA